jgi:hypothetical protein
MRSTMLMCLVGAALYAGQYVTTRISLPSAVGYERAWDWQLFFFALTRLPLLTLLLAVVLWPECRLLRG